MAEIILGILAILAGLASIVIAFVVLFGTAMGQVTAPDQGQGNGIVVFIFLAFAVAMFVGAGVLLT